MDFGHFALLSVTDVFMYFAAGITRGMNKVTIGSGPPGASAGYGEYTCNVFVC